MRRPFILVSFAAPLALAGVLAGCGGSAKTNAAPPTTASAPSPAKPAASGNGLGALQAEAAAVATGDIPDNQVFLTFDNGAAAYSMRYPEGWAQQGSGARVTFRDKNNIVRILVGSGPAPTEAEIRSELGALRGAQMQSVPKRVTVGGKPAFEVVYTTESAPNAVTGKRVKLVVDRYYLAHAGKRAVVDLGTPEGVDNVDAYRMMIGSFRWK